MPKLDEGCVYIFIVKKLEVSMVTKSFLLSDVNVVFIDDNEYNILYLMNNRRECFIKIRK